MSISIELKDLSIGYKARRGAKVVAAGLNATLHAGEMTCLLGPNGAGKSTLLRTLAAFQPALAGTVEMMGREVRRSRHSELSRLVSVVLTDNAGIRNMTAAEVVAMGRSPHTGFWGRLGEKDRLTVAKCMEWVGVSALKDRKIHTLSDGERQKVMIAKAIAQETPVILLDEPTAFLDYPSKIGMMLLLHRLAKTLGKCVFMSTHDMEHALRVADNVWLLDGELGLTTGTPEDLSLDGSLERYFARDGLVFDPERVAFEIARETARTVRVEGAADTLQYKLCCQALARQGISPVTAADDTREPAEVAVRIPGDGTFRLVERGEETFSVKKIGHLVHLIVPTITKHQITAIREAADMNQYE